MAKTVLILGASRYYIRGIETAKRLGYRTVVVDRHENSPGFAFADESCAIDIMDHQGVLEYARSVGIDGIVPINDYGVMTAARVAENLGLPGLGVETAETVTNKARLRRQWQAAGQPNPEFRIVEDLAQCRLACDQIGLPVIFKPAVSMGGGRGIAVVTSASEIAEAYACASRAYDHDSTILVEQFVEGLEHSAEVLLHEGKGHVLAVSDKVKTPMPVRIDHDVVYPTRLSGQARQKLERAIVESVECLGITVGCMHVECCTLPSGDIRLFELGGRPGGGGTPDPIVPFLTGVNEFEEYLRLCVGEAPVDLAPRYERGCCYRFLILEPGRVRAVGGLSDILKWDGILDAAVFVGPGDEVRPVRTGADRSGFIIAGGEGREEAQALAHRAEDRLVFEYHDPRESSHLPGDR